jgi:inorganic pyrophosphatase
MTNLWHELPPGPDPPDVIYVVVEIPKRSRNKTVYKDLQHVRVETMGWEECEIAGQEIERAINLYAQSLRTHR